jgi:hypothetical protein
MTLGESLFNTKTKVHKTLPHAEVLLNAILYPRAFLKVDDLNM